MDGGQIEAHETALTPWPREQVRSNMASYKLISIQQYSIWLQMDEGEKILLPDLSL